MTGIVSELSLATDTDSDDVEQYLTGALATNLGTIGGKFAAAGGHGHTGATGDAGRIGTAGLAAGAATGAVLGPEVPVRIATIGPLTVAAATIVFASIQQTYRHLRLEVYARSDTAATNAGLRVQLNGDTLAHYYTQRINASAATVTASESLADTSARVGLIPAATASSTLMGATTITLLHYAQANKEKSLHAEGFCPTAISTGTMTVTAEGGFWDNPAAITQITLLPAAGNFTADSIAVLYGLP